MMNFRRTSRSPWLYLLTLASMMLLGGSAWAQGSGGVAVGLDFKTSDMDQDLVRELEEIVDGAFKDASGWTFIGFERARNEIKSGQKDCYTKECLNEIGEQFNAKRGLSIEMSGAAEVYKWTFRSWDLESGSRIDAQEGACELCGKAELREAFEQSMRGSVQVVAGGAGAQAGQQRGEVLLHITALPEDAEIIINDEPVAQGEVTLPVEPGAYDVHVRREGYRDMKERVIVSREGGGPVVLRVYLTPTEAAAAAASEGAVDSMGSMRTTLGIVGLGAGIAALGASIYLTAIDGNPACDDGTPARACPDVYATAGTGLVMGILGGVLVTSGATLLSWDLLTGKSKNEDQIDGSDAPDGSGDGESGDEQARVNSGATLSISPGASHDGAGFLLHGTF